MNLYFYPDYNSYLVGPSRNEYHVIDSGSSAFSRCEFLRYNYPASQERDIEGVFCLNIKVPSSICKLLIRFIVAENLLSHELTTHHLVFSMEFQGDCDE